MYMHTDSQTDRFTQDEKRKIHKRWREINTC